MWGLRKPREGRGIQLVEYGRVPVTGTEHHTSISSIRSRVAKWLPTWPKVFGFRLHGKGFKICKNKTHEHEETPFLSRSPPTHRQRQRRFDLGKGSHLCILLVTLMFVLNLSVAIWGITADLEREDGLVTLRRYTCGWTKRANSVLHIALNILASTLLGASSYMMQRLAAPTRDDIDRAHQKYKSVQIGSLSFDCFSYMSRRKLVIFFVLWMSSIPIHLL